MYPMPDTDLGEGRGREGAWHTMTCIRCQTLTIMLTISLVGYRWVNWEGSESKGGREDREKLSWLTHDDMYPMPETSDHV